MVGLMLKGIRQLKISFVSQILLLIIGMATHSCLAWFLGPEGRGAFAVTLVFSVLLNIVFFVGCDISTVYFVSSKKFNISEGITYSLIYSGIGSFLAILTGLFLMQFPLSFFDKATPLMFYLALATIPFVNMTLILTNLFTAVQDFKSYAFFSVVNVLTRLILTVVFVKFFLLGPAGALLAILTSTVFFSFLLVMVYRIKYDFRFIKPDFAKIKEMAGYGVKYYLGQLSNNVNFQAGTTILSFFANKMEIGLFDVAAQFAGKTMIIPDTLITVLIPKLSHEGEKKTEMVAQCARLTFFVTCLLFFVLNLFMTPIVKILFSSEFLPVVGLFRILCFGVIIRSSCKIFAPYFLGINKPGIVSLSSASSAISNLVALILLLPIWGLNGAAIAMVIGWGVGSMMLLNSFRNSSKLSFVDIWFPKKTDLNFFKSMIVKGFEKWSGKTMNVK